MRVASKEADVVAMDPEQSVSGSTHSYESFARQAFYREVDRQLLIRAPVVSKVVDLATGTGAIIEQLIELGKLKAPFEVIGVDIDPQGLAIAREKFKAYGDSIRFIEGPAESVPEIAGGSQDLVTFCNSIHLTDVERSIAEAARMLKPGGVLLVNSAYEKNSAYPEGTQRVWGMLVSLARRGVAEHGYTDIPRPIDLMRYSEEDFQRIATGAGFEDVCFEYYTAKMDRESVRAISDYEDFARGALPTVPVDVSARALVAAVDPVFERFKIEFIPRNWMFLIARKGSA